MLGKVAVITGVSGIGQELAIAYARAGARSVVGYYPVDPHEVLETVDTVASLGGSCAAVAVDVADPTAVDKLAHAAVTEFGRLDIAVAALAVNSLGSEGLAKVAKGISAGRVGTVAEAARAVRFLTSDDASCITGQHIVADGGLSVRVDDNWFGEPLANVGLMSTRANGDRSMASRVATADTSARREWIERFGSSGVKPETSPGQGP